MVSLSVSSCVRRFLAWVNVNRRPKTHEHYRYQLGRFVKLHGRRRVTALTPAMLESFGRSAHLKQSVQRLCAWLHRSEKTLAANPLAGMPKPRTGMRKRILERVDVVRLLRAADRDFRPFLLVLRETMCRPQEARGLRWDDVCDGSNPGDGRRVTANDAGYLVLPAAKGYEWRRDQFAERVIPISPRLGRLLERLARRPVTLAGAMLINSLGRPWTSNAVRLRFRRLRFRLGLVADRRGERVVAYTLRHTTATAAAAAGVGTWMLAGMLGHSSPRTSERYVHPRPADLVNAAKVLWESKGAFRPKNDRPGSPRNRPDGSR